MLKEKILDKIIQGRRSIRSFNKKRISKRTIESIINSAIWAPCPHGFQPWKFVILNNKSEWKSEILNFLEKNIDKVAFGLRTILQDNIRIIKQTDTLIAVFNTKTLQKRGEKLGGAYKTIFNIFEIQSIAASIQNILLKAFSKGLGSIWIGLPLLFKRQIADILHEENAEFMAFIVLGYTNSSEIKTDRISIKEKIKYV